MKRAAVAAMLSALATGAVLATVGFGADTTATSSEKKSTKSARTTQAGPPKTMKQVHDEMQTRRAAHEKKLAGALGVSAEQLRAALDKLQKDRLDAQVKANRLTQAQEDAILACKDQPLTCDRSNLPAGGHGGGPGHHGGMRGDSGTFAADLAKALDLETAKVESALKSVRPAGPAGGGMFGRGHGGRGGHGGPGGPGGHGPGGPGGPGMSGGDMQGPPPGV